MLITLIQKLLVWFFYDFSDVGNIQNFSVDLQTFLELSLLAANFGFYYLQPFCNSFYIKCSKKYSSSNVANRLNLSVDLQNLQKLSTAAVNYNFIACNASISNTVFV